MFCDLQKLKTSKAQMEATGNELKNMGRDPLTKNKLNNGNSSSEVKDPLAGLNSKDFGSLAIPTTGGVTNLLGGLESGKDPFSALGISDPLKDLGIGSNSSFEAPENKTKPVINNKLSKEENLPKDKFSEFDFISNTFIA